MSERAREAVIVDTLRTPIGRRKGRLSGWHPADLLGFALTELVERTGVDPERVDDVVGGCVTQVGEQSTNVIRNAWVGAGLPQSVAATTVDRQCGSSQQAVHFAAQGVIAGAYDLVVACGVESMSRVPMASNASGGLGPFTQQYLSVIDGQLMTQFEISQILAGRWGITREQMDSFAAESHRRADEATRSGAFATEIVPVPERNEEGVETGEVVTVDEGIRPETTVEVLAGLGSAAKWDPSIAPDITAGNSSQTSDGAAAMLIAERSVAEALGLPVRAAFRHFAVGGDDAVLVLSAPNPVTRKLLERSGMSIADFDAIECNEAFAAIALMWAAEFLPDGDLSRYNPRGGAIALGHPLGASGVRLMTTLVNQLEATGGRYGYQTMCEGGGMANGTVVERLG
jgi:acetyl-CoA acyltransferase